MKRPGFTSTDHPTADWSHNCDDIAAASRGHRLEVPLAPTSRSGFASPDGSPHRHSSATTHSANRPTPTPRLGPFADGPDLDADSTDVGAWMAIVITAIAGHRPGGPSYRDFPADGYTRSPGQ